MTNAYPLEWPDGWPRTPYHKRKEGTRFRTTFSKAREDLFTELRRLGAQNVTLSTNLPLRADGMPYADAARRRIDDSGVAVYFTLRGKPLVMARDGYTVIHYNLRSVGLAIEHLRGLERHGGATMMDRAFSGFMALPGPSDGEKTWREVFGYSEGMTPDLASLDGRFRALAKERHPDGGGNSEAYLELTVARAAAIKEVGPR